MPTQRTNIISATERNAARHGLDLSIPPAKEAMDGALAAARLNASTAALDGALPERGAAEPMAASRRIVSSLLKRYWHAFRERRQRRSLGSALPHLSERELMDIGLTYGEIDYIASRRAIDTLRDEMYLWTRGVM